LPEGGELWSGRDRPDPYHAKEVAEPWPFVEVKQDFKKNGVAKSVTNKFQNRTWAGTNRETLEQKRDEKRT